MGDCDDDENSINSSDECLLDMLGLSSLKDVSSRDDDEEREVVSSLPDPNLSNLAPLRDKYQNEAVFQFPRECWVAAKHLRIMTEEVARSGTSNNSYPADRTYESIKIWKDGEIEERKTLTRLENFVDTHPGWNELCHEYLPRILSAALGEEMVLFKEKLNLKPPGGSGFAPHLDSPSLRIALGSEGPKTFCTVMVAIDDMTSKNGCLRVCKGSWSEENCCDVIQPEKDGSPDAGGRAGAIPSETAEGLVFEDLVCKGGAVFVFNGWVPHRSCANTSPFPRRAIFLTYNPKREGEYHTMYYERMEQLRNDWREKIGLAKRQQRLEDEKFEQLALSSVPK